MCQYPLPLARDQPHLLIPFAQTINQEITKNPEIRSNFYQIILPWPTYTNPSVKRGSDKINIQKQERNTQKNASRIARAGLTYESQHLEKQTWNPVLREEPIGPEPW